jgi:hypothetical protein
MDRYAAGLLRNKYMNFAILFLLCDFTPSGLGASFSGLISGL